ncbi:hypothetical protein QBC34DRAFT_392922 [Podospora aff. communis PSN243]|uniref:Uncharacterized protein n=1 Tax=Podospora aff. communis PSN243 TaxID=3040156 RepID=A0AAV9H0V5_9PEZI|nr:hypothetical protein QBC34DRAFT_392922 [Podospora aff. communis PSN243]
MTNRDDPMDVDESGPPSPASSASSKAYYDKRTGTYPKEKGIVYNDQQYREDSQLESLMWYIGRNPKYTGEKQPTFIPQGLKSKLKGSTKFAVYVPPWTNPRWEDHTTVKGKVSGQPITFERRDVSMLVRPALLPEDEKKNPTEYAKRYGINPDAASEGRSRMSPDRSTSRKATVTTDTGAEVTVTGEDFRNEYERSGRSMDTLFQTIEAVDPKDPRYAYYQALKRFFNVLADDRDYQRLLMRGLTTDERLRHGYDPIDPDVDIPQCTLSGEPFFLFRREMWLNPEKTRGNQSHEPRVLYNMFGEMGEYSAHNDLIWAAMQPAILLATRILETNPPFWMTIMDPFNLRHVPKERDPMHGKRDVQLVSFFDRFAHGAPPPTEQMNKLDQEESVGRDFYKVIAWYLGNFLDLDIMSTRQMRTGQEDPASIVPPAATTWGVTFPIPRASNKPSTMPGLRPAAEIRVRLAISAEVIWPLLVPGYSLAEKANCSFKLANTLCHELMHATRIAMRFVLGRLKPSMEPGVEMAPIDVRDIPVLNEMSPDRLARLADEMSLYMEQHSDREGYWRHEPREEMGNASENQVWGGNPDSMNETEKRAFPLLRMMATSSLVMHQWPAAEKNPNSRYTKQGDAGNKGLKEYVTLLDPPLPHDTYYSPIPVREVGRLFQEAFWKDGWSTFGATALRFNQDQVPLSTRVRYYYREKDVLRTLGTITKTLRDGLNELEKADQPVVCEYIRESLMDRIFPVTVRKQWLALSKMWPWNLQALEDLRVPYNKAMRTAQQIRHLLTDEEEMAKEMEAANMDRETLLKDLHNVVNSWMKSVLYAVMDLHRFFSLRVQEAQFEIVDYVRLQPDARAVIYKRYAMPLYQVLQNYRDNAKVIIQDLEQLSAAWKTSIGPVHQEMVQKMITGLNMDANLFEELQSYLTKNWVNREGAPRVFSTVPHSMYKKRSRQLEKMALRELELMPAPFRRFTERLLGILHTAPINVHDTDEDGDNPPPPIKPPPAPHELEPLPGGRGRTTRRKMRPTDPNLYHSMGMYPPQPMPPARGSSASFAPQPPPRPVHIRQLPNVCSRIEGAVLAGGSAQSTSRPKEPISQGVRPGSMILASMFGSQSYIKEVMREHEKKSTSLGPSQKDQGYQQGYQDFDEDEDDMPIDENVRAMLKAQWEHAQQAQQAQPAQQTQQTQQYHPTTQQGQQYYGHVQQGQQGQQGQHYYGHVQQGQQYYQGQQQGQRRQGQQGQGYQGQRGQGQQGQQYYQGQQGQQHYQEQRGQGQRGRGRGRGRGTGRGGGGGRRGGGGV